MSDAQRLIRVPPWLSESLRRYFDSTATIPPNAANPLFTVPVELLIHILQYLPANSIALVQTVCRTLHDVVKNSAALQFIIETFLAGVAEGPAVSSLTTSRARLDRLTDWVHTRRGIHWEKVWECQFPEIGMDFLKYRRIHGQTFSLLDDYNAHTLHFTTIPSRLAGTELKTWSITFPWPVIEHWLDSSKDVVVIRSHSFENQSFLAFSHLPTGNPFPEIPVTIYPLYRHPDEARHGLHVDVRILGNLNIIYRHFRSFRRDIRIRDWRSNETFLNIYSESEHDFPDKIAFLDAGHLVGTVLSHGLLPACIVVIPWRRLPEKNISFTNALHYSTIFALPWHRPSHKFAPRRLCLWPKFNAPCEHNTTGSDDTARGVQFIDAGLQPPLLMFNLEITPDVDVDYPDLLGDLYEPLGMTTPLRFVIPGHALLSHVAALDAATNGRRRMRMVPWCGWGEDTRVWEGAGSGMAVYGSRLFCWERTENWRTKAVIYDFDSPESMVRDIHSGNKTRLNEIVVKPSCLPQTFRRNVQEPMITKAPYRRLETNLEGPGSNRCMLFGENCFVLAETTNHRFAAYSI